jgi:predicted acetyltransferase
VRGTGLIARGEPVWLALLAPEGVRIAVVPSDGAPGSLDGYLVYRLIAEGASHSVEMEVLEMIALTDAASYALQGFLAAQGDQVSRVHLSVGGDEPLVALLSDPRGPTGEMVRGLLMVSAELTVGAMTRIVDLSGALRARGYDRTGSLALRIEDPVIPDNGQPVTLRVEGPRADVVPGRLDGVPLLECDVATLAQIYAGLVTPSQAVGLRLARIDPADALPTVDGLLRTRPAHTLDVF